MRAALAGLLACGLCLVATTAASTSQDPLITPSSNPVHLSLVESSPTATQLDSEDLVDFHHAWAQQIAGARQRIDLAHFYASDAGEGGASDPDHPTRLTPVVRALEAAAARGVAVRFLTHAGFQETYPALLDRLERAPGIEVRAYTMPALDAAGHIVEEPGPGDARPGAMHAKYMLVDGLRGTFGSANFDWRSLEHIQELGVVFGEQQGRAAGVASAFQAVFDLDWHLAGGGDLGDWEARPATPALPARGQLYTRRGGGAELGVGVSTAFSTSFPFQYDDGTSLGLVYPGTPIARVTPVFSPRGLLPDERLWDLPHLVSAIDSAKQRVLVQVLTYKPTTWDGYWAELDGALRRAEGRGVDVRLLVADWGKRRSTVPGLKSLAVLPNAEVRFVTIPPAVDEAGAEVHIPFGRVIHSKYLVVDDTRSWIGTSNWERSYFESGRNVGLFFEGAHPTTRLGEYFEHTWDSDYAETLDPGADYVAPDYGERD
ncbi:MAG: phospholipase D-like domain-containing protein [Planctomycetota bacterium]|nr:phospholipase D-like domain-containing protein [Planctomycetota bacterium]